MKYRIKFSGEFEADNLCDAAKKSKEQYMECVIEEIYEAET